MFSHQLYNVVHILGIAALVAALGGMAVHAGSGATRASLAARRLVASLHGIGALLILVGGFGMLARLGIAQAGFPPWVWLKIVVWALLAAAAALPYRRPSLAGPLLVIVPLLAAVAAWAAIYKPG